MILRTPSFNYNKPGWTNSFLTLTPTTHLLLFSPFSLSPKPATSSLNFSMIPSLLPLFLAASTAAQNPGAFLNLKKPLYQLENIHHNFRLKPQGLLTNFLIHPPRHCRRWKDIHSGSFTNRTRGEG